MNFLKKKSSNISFQNLNRTNYFEGWYYKFVSEDEKTMIAFIPSFHRNKNETYSMIQCVLGTYSDKWEVQTDWIKYDIKRVKTRCNPFELNIGGNIFQEDKINIKFSGTRFEIKGEIKSFNLQRLPSSFLNPNIMGFFSYVPGMQCIHEIISLDHELKGSLKINGKKISFNNGRGYMEKDLGSSFPKHYIWIQSNHFKKRPSSLFFSWANIPMKIFDFNGFICHLWTGDKDIRFATYTASSCKINYQSPTKVEIFLENKKYILRIWASKRSFIALKAPINGMMSAQIKEGLGGLVKYELLDKKTGEVIRDISHLGGVEIVNKLQEIVID